MKNELGTISKNHIFSEYLDATVETKIPSGLNTKNIYGARNAKRTLFQNLMEYLTGRSLFKFVIFLGYILTYSVWEELEWSSRKIS